MKRAWQTATKGHKYHFASSMSGGIDVRQTYLDPTDKQ
jgi:hypothetical protein